MQNIFYNKKRKICIILAVFLMSFLSVLYVAMYANMHDKIYVQQENVTKSMYPSSSSLSADKQPKNVVEKTSKIKMEMNNEFAKNSKSFNLYRPSASFDGLGNTSIKVLFSDGRVRNMELEDYIVGCVLGEMPLDFEIQALMAQSVAVRSFTVKRKLDGTSKHRNADVCTDFNCCQCYKSPESVKLTEEKYNKLMNCVKMTKGIIALYDGQPIEAAYHASSGECTLNSEEVWGGKVEYLRSVKSPVGETEIYKNGYGHRVGMSQHGANLLAKQGFGYTDILKYYYTGISFGFI